MNRRPKLTLLGHSATPEEAAAVIAAVEQFMRDTAPAAVPAAEPVSPWLRTARLEAVRERHEPSPWGDRHPWG